MNKQQAFLLSLGAEIADICTRHNIKFFLAHGSLIGAVRHGGIIPWDDDFDIFMPYPEWLKFKALCQDPANLPANRVLCCPDVQESYLHVMPRYVATDTTCIHKNQSLHKDYAGQVIDIFILDPVADDAFEAYQKDLFLYYDMLIYSDTIAARVNASVEEYLKLCEYRDQHGKLAASRLCEERLCSHFDDDGQYYAHRWQGSATVFRRSDFESQVFVPVGPYKLPIPSGYNGVMRSSYGDEWPLMPKNANPAKHDAPASLKIPYEQALEYFHPSLDSQEILMKMQARKPDVLARGNTKHFLEDNWAQLRGELVSMELDKRMSGHEQELERALAARDGVALNELLGDYVDWQIDRTMLGRRFAALFWRYQHPVFINVSDSVFEALVLALMCTERIGRAAQVLQVRRERFKLSLTPLMNELEKAIGRFREATDLLCAGKPGEALPLAKELAEAYPAAISFWRLELACLDKLRAACGENLLEEEERLLGEALKCYPSDGYFMFYQLECRRARGEEPDNEYPVAAELTVNGLVLSQIQARYGYAPSWLRNKKWAKSNGIPQWDGPEPQLPSALAPENGMPACDSQKLCLALLQELANVCDELGLSYVCSPKLAKALFVNNKVPAHMKDFALYMSPKDALKLSAELKTRKPQNRVLSGLGIDELDPASLFYGAVGTCALSLRKPLAQQHACLGVHVHALIPQDTADALLRTLRQYSAGAPCGTFKPEGKKAVAYALLHGIKCVSQDAATKLLKALATRELDAGRPASFITEGKIKSVAPIDFAALCSASFHELGFAVPQDLNKYCAGIEVETANSFNADPKFIASVRVGSQELLAAHEMPQGFDERIAWYRACGAKDAQIMQLFSQNYAQLHLAVKLKELSLKLLPKKDAIVKMHEQGDIEGLKKALKGYKNCYKKYHEIGVVELDPQIDAALKAIL